MRRAAYCLIGLVLTAMPTLADDDDKSSGEQAASVLVTTEMPAKGKLDQPVTAYGVVQPAPGGALAVASLHAAQVIRLRIVAGQVVAAGEPLLDLGADPAASLAYAQAMSDLKLAQSELARMKQMLAERLANQSQLEQAVKAEADAEATLDARRREGGTKPLETLNAPIGGVITSVAVSNGDHVQPGATMLDIAAKTEATAVLGVAPEARRRIKPGQMAKLIDLDAPDGAIDATILTVGDMADPKTGLFTVVAKPADGKAQDLPNGAHVRATVYTDGSEGWIVPRDAVLTDSDGPYVFQIEGGKAKRVGVIIVGAGDDKLAISGSIDPKKKLVAAGNYELSDGGAVREAAGTGAADGKSGAAEPAEKKKPE